MTDELSHLIAIQQRLSHEQARLDVAKTDRERATRQVWVDSCHREIEAEIAFLAARGIHVPTLEDVFADLSDDELLAELMA